MNWKYNVVVFDSRKRERKIVSTFETMELAERKFHKVCMDIETEEGANQNISDIWDGRGKNLFFKREWIVLEDGGNIHITLEMEPVR